MACWWGRSTRETTRGALNTSLTRNTGLGAGNWSMILRAYSLLLLTLRRTSSDVQPGREGFLGVAPTGFELVLRRDEGDLDLPREGMVVASYSGFGDARLAPW